MMALITQKLNEKWSPEQKRDGCAKEVSGLSAMNAFICISGKIKKQVVSYTYICADTVRSITSAVMVKQTEGK